MDDTRMAPDPTNEKEGPSRRGLLECMAWAGAGVLWTVSGGVPRSRLIGSAEAAPAPSAGLSFMQISDSHIGFANAPNTDVPGTLREAIALVKERKGNAALMIHTGDVSQLSRAAQFDMAEQIIQGAGLETHYVPGEHDVLEDEGKTFFERFTKAGPCTASTRMGCTSSA